MRYLISTILSLLALSFGTVVNASTIVDFEDMTLNNYVDNYDYWHEVRDPDHINDEIQGVISNTQYYSGTKSLRINNEGGYNYIYFDGFTPTTGTTTFDFWVYYPDRVDVHLFNDSDCAIGVGSMTWLSIESSRQIYIYGFATGKYVVDNGWTHVYWEYDYSANKTRVSVDDGASWSTYKSGYPTTDKSIVGLGFKSLDYSASDYVYIDDVNIPTDEKDEIQVVIVNTLGYGLNIISPSTTNFPNYSITPDYPMNVTFTMNYSIPNQASSSDILLRTYELDSSTSTTGTLLSIDSIKNLDTTLSHVVRSTIEFSSSTDPRYFEFQLYDVASDQVMYNLRISNNDINFTNTTDQDLGFWGNLYRSLFVLSPSVSEDLTESKEDLLTRVPFGYVTLVKEQVASSSYSGSALDTSNMGSGGSTIFTPFKTLFTTALWLVFAIYLVIRIKKLVIK